MSTGVDSVPIPGSPTSDNKAPTPSSTPAPQVQDQDEEYDMSGPRKAFILCVKKKRSGAETELNILRKCLKDLNFQVTECIDPLGEDILGSLEKYRDGMNSKVCCSFVYILAHGDEGEIYGSDDDVVDLEDVFDTFNNKECAILQSKPKVFIVQACRGDKKDAGVETGFRAMAASEPEKLPTSSDSFIVYPARPGYVAYRDRIKGSHMIQIMAEVFEKLADKKHLYDLFVKVNREMVKKNFHPGVEAMKTTLVMESTLTKSVYLKVPKQ